MLVKNEAIEDSSFHTTTSFSHPQTTSHPPTDDDVTIAHLSPSPLSVKFKLKDPTEKSTRRVKIKRRPSDSKKIKHTTSSHGKNSMGSKQGNAGTGGLGSPEFKSSALIRAEEVQSNLEPGFPSFLKSLVRSHVGSCFWMGLPGTFCRQYLPHDDTTVTLEDEYGEGYKMKYIAHKTGLSAGWRQFAVAQRLLEGDVLVFQLIGDCKFKVYVIRANDLTEVDGALGLLNLEAQIMQNFAVRVKEDAMVTYESRKRKRTRSHPLVKRSRKSGKPRSSFSNIGHPAEQSENDSEEVASEVLEGFKSLPDLEFKDMKSFENFNISVDGLALDSELMEDIRSKYYKLCCSQNALLHENLIKGINFKLIAGLITETVNIADALQACEFSTSREEFVTWDKTLKASELFGLNVGFLRARLSHLLHLAFETEGATETRRYIEARAEQAQKEEEIRDLKIKLAELKAAYENYGTNISGLKSKAENYEQIFTEEVTAPW